MCMQDVDALTVSECPQPFGALPIDPRLSPQMFDVNACGLKLLSKSSDVIKYSHDAAKVGRHSLNHLLHQHLGTAYSQRMNDMADGGTLFPAIARVFLKTSDLDHDWSEQEGSELAAQCADEVRPA